MRVTLAVDALEFRRGGIGRYTWELCKGLPVHEGVTSVRYFGRNRMIRDPHRLLAGELLPPRSNVIAAWLQTRSLRSGLCHGPNYFLPRFADTGVITAHDLSVFRYPETHPAARVRAFEKQFLKSVGRAAQIITDTETVRREIIETFGVAPDRVTAVPLGVDPSFRPLASEAIESVLKQWQLQPRQYGLCVSTLEPRKKISELLAAWRRLPRKIRDFFPLVLCGGAGWRNDAMLEQVREGVAEGWLRHLGFVDEATLPQIYAGAALFIYPSIYEGFGLPPIEAMASAVPVMTSRHSCMPEVCGDAARYFDPDDANGFVAALIENLGDQRWHREAIDRGIRRASQYSWQRCIDATVEVYCRALAVI